MRISNIGSPLGSVAAAMAVFLCGASALFADTAPATPAEITGKAYRLEHVYLVSAHVPTANVDKVLAAVVAAVGLEYGHYDRVAYIDPLALEQFRPMKGSKSGESQVVRRSPTQVISFSIPHDAATLKKALDALYTAHSAEEPVIYIADVWRTRSTNPDDSNPNRWWNQQPR